MLKVKLSGQACGAEVSGVDLSQGLDTEMIEQIRALWLTHKVLAFPEQNLSDEDLVRITGYFGALGDDPYFESIAPDNPVVALTRRADEKAPVFAESWHSDWSFKEEPPIGTCLYGITIPPVGGNTGFIDQEKALTEMPADLRSRIEGLKGLHSAAGAYAPEGTYGEKEKDSDRSMKIVYSETAREIFAHPLVRVHPETGAQTLFGCLGYIIGIEGMEQEEARSLLTDLYIWQTREAFQYTHRWQPNMLVMWDNRCVIHRAYGGYDGHDRELHRTTIGVR